MIDELIVNIAKILAVLGVFFIFFKQFRNRTTNESYHKFYKKYRKLFYHLHVTGIKLATLLGFVHGITIKPIDQTYIISGWLFLLA